MLYSLISLFFIKKMNEAMVVIYISFNFDFLTKCDLNMGGKMNRTQ